MTSTFGLSKPSRLSSPQRTHIKMNGAQSHDGLFEKLASLYQGELNDFPWHSYAALIFQVNDKMELVGETWRAVLARTQNQDDLLQAARQMRESLLKASVLVGFPKVHMVFCSVTIRPG